jgi:hypothetical protein
VGFFGIDVFTRKRKDYDDKLNIGQSPVAFPSNRERDPDGAETGAEPGRLAPATSRLGLGLVYRAVLALGLRSDLL